MASKNNTNIITNKEQRKKNYQNKKKIQHKTKYLKKTTSQIK